MEIGEYVRTKEKILKIDSFEKDKRNIDCVCFTTGEICTLELLNEIMTKHSKNIIDLIENGDVLKVKTDENEIVYIGIDENTIDISYKEILDDIKQSYKLLEILTHEQYESNCYKLEE